MASFDIVIARSRFNFPNDISKFLGDTLVTLNCFELFGDFIKPTKFMVVLTQEEEMEEHLVELTINAANNTYFPHYLGWVINPATTSVSIKALTDEAAQVKESVSYSMVFETSGDDGDNGNGLKNSPNETSSKNGHKKGTKERKTKNHVSFE